MAVHSSNGRRGLLDLTRELAFQAVCQRVGGPPELAWEEIEQGIDLALGHLRHDHTEPPPQPSVEADLPAERFCEAWPPRPRPGEPADST